MKNLLDVNLLIALAWPSHIHHECAHEWFNRNVSKGWATCPITQSGFVRISANPKFVSGAVSVHEALFLLHKAIASPEHTFWSDDYSLLDTNFFQKGLLVGHRQITDVYLLGLAIKHGGRLATLDRKLTGILPQNSPYQEVLTIVE